LPNYISEKIKRVGKGKIEKRQSFRNITEGAAEDTGDTELGIKKTGKEFMDLDVISGKVIGCAIEVHRFLGPGLLESTYEQCLIQELKHANLSCATQVPIPIIYRGTTLECGYRADMIIENTLLLELKSVDQLSPLYQAQILTYLRHANLPLGLLMNFNVTLLKHGIMRFRL